MPYFWTPHNPQIFVYDFYKNLKYFDPLEEMGNFATAIDIFQHPWLFNIGADSKNDTFNFKKIIWCTVKALQARKICCVISAKSHKYSSSVVWY